MYNNPDGSLSDVTFALLHRACCRLDHWTYGGVPSFLKSSGKRRHGYFLRPGT